MKRRRFLIGSMATAQSTWLFGETKFVSLGPEAACVAAWDRMLRPSEIELLTQGFSPHYITDGLTHYAPMLDVTGMSHEAIEGLIP